MLTLRSGLFRYHLCGAASLRIFAVALALFAYSHASAGELIVVKSKFIHQDDSVLVFSPVQVQGRDIPTLFLLHGRSGNFRSWSDKVDLQEVADRTGWRIICPDGQKRSWYINSPGNMWRDFFWQELWPILDLRFGLDSAKTFITGLSMGGAGAINIFLDHPERFRAAGTMSGSLNFLYETTSARKEVPAMLGDTEDGKPLTNAESAVTRILQADPAAMKDKMIVITCGTGDDLLPCSRLLEERCISQGIPCTAMYSPGIHNWKYWTHILEHHIRFFQELP